MLLLMAVSQAQSLYPTNGVADERAEVFAFVNARIQKAPGKMVDGGVLVIRKGKIVAVGQSGAVAVPEDAVVYDLGGKYIYPAFLDLYSSYGMPEVSRTSGEEDEPIWFSEKRGPFGWNAAVKPEVQAADMLEPDAKAAAALREAGFGLVLTQQQDGIIRGTAALVHLVDGKANEAIAQPMAAGGFSFSKGSSPMGYPSSLMGAIALIRQTWYDAQWYARARTLDDTPYDASLQAMTAMEPLPALFAVDDIASGQRAIALGTEFNKRFILKGRGDEYQQAQWLAARQQPVVIPLVFPDAYDVEDPYGALHISLPQLMHWEMAPANAAMLAKEGVPFAFTTDGLDKPQDIWKQLRKVRSYGLSDSLLLAALTTQPASMLGIGKDAGTLDAGKTASFFIASAPLWDDDMQVLESWIHGQRHLLVDHLPFDIRGTYAVAVGDATHQITLSGSYTAPKATWVYADSAKATGTVSLHADLIRMTVSIAPDSGAYLILTGKAGKGSMSGEAILPGGERTTWKAVLQEVPQPSVDTATTAAVVKATVIYPFQSFGRPALPTQERVVFRHATVWTGEVEGILENTDVLIDNGFIISIGQNLAVRDAREVDATGLHLTAGIIDEHSHIAVARGVNEGTQAVTAEVRIGDVVRPDDINIYRQLAGGVTTSQLLHGSANPIGGQSAIIKLRWGQPGEQMKMENAAPFIKFALGENVKQSNWGDNERYRFPQTRMGVEQVMYDAFHRAEAYLAGWEAYNNLSRRDRELAIPPRRDLELEALGEILQQERFITCHSYVQSEINMLMKVADSFGFTLNTFTHILEGYKVADKMKAHGSGASTFSDWWAYKYEVIEAIPHNASLLHEMGVVTAINSDDAEMGRRLNQEAAKAMKYGGMTEEEAWNLVTLNPARLLRIDHKVGSIQVGKDADLVLWTDHPLSVYAQVLQTWVDGRKLFDQEEDRQMRTALAAERHRLIQAMLAARQGGAATRPVPKPEEKLYHCDDMEDEGK